MRCMQKLAIAFLCFTLGMFSAQAQTPLPSGKPAGTSTAQSAQDLIYIYGGVALFGAVLYAFIGTLGNAPVTTSPTNTTSGH